MARYAINYDLDTVLMDERGVNDSNRTRIYNLGKRVLEANGLRYVQHSMYATEDNEQAFETAMEAAFDLPVSAAEFCSYLRRINLVRIDETANILCLIRKNLTV